MSPDSRISTPTVRMVRTADGRGAVRMDDLYDTDVDDLWSSLTEAPRLARWIAEVEGDLCLGGDFRASFTSGWTGTGRVTVCDPPRRLMVTMSPGQDDETVIEAVLVVHGDRTRLVLEERGLPVDELPAHGAGWQAHVEDLSAHLAGRARLDWRTRWVELSPADAAQAADIE